MPSWCAAKNCTNASKNGVKMNYFPRDAGRRQKWINNCASLGGMSNWLPADHSVLCEYHFAADMWEKERVDGKKKLKYNAVPTIFGDLVYQVTKKSSKEPASSTDSNQLIVVQMDPIKKEVHLEPETEVEKIFPSVSIDIAKDDDPMIATVLNDETSKLIEPAESCNSILKTPCIAGTVDEYSDDDLRQQERDFINLHQDFIDIQNDIHKKYEILQKMFHKSERLRIAMRRKHKKKVVTLKRLVKKLQYRLSVLKENEGGVMQR